MIRLEELVEARALGEELREQGVDPLQFINKMRGPQAAKNNSMPIKAADGVEVKAPGEELPQLQVGGINMPKKLFGINFGTQAAESFSGTTEDESVFDPKKHKMKPSQLRELIKQISIKGMMLKKEDKEIMSLINNSVSKAGYTNDELSPEKIKSKAIKGYELYNGNQPNPFPAYKLISSIIGGTAGNIVGGKAGARIGASIGRLGGPWGMIAGSMIGGTLGYVGSLLGYELTLNNLNRKGMLYTPTYNEIGEFIGNRQGINRPKKEELINYLKHEAKIDAMFQGGFFAARPVFKALGMGFSNIALGVGKAERQLGREIAQTTGISPSIVDISRYDIIRAAPTVIGRLPFFRRPFVKAAREQKEALLNTAKNKIFLDGPTFTLAELGHDMSAVRDRVSKEIVESVNKKYNSFYEALGDNPAIVWNTTRAKAMEGTKFLESLGIPPTDLFKNSLYRNMSNLAGTAEDSVFKAGAPMTAAQWKQQRTMFTNELLNNPTLTVEMKDVGRNVLRGLEEDLANTVKSNPTMYKNADKLLQEADRSFKDMMILFGDPTVKELGKDSKFAYVNMLKQPGNKYASELLDTTLKEFRDPLAMERLHNILGDQMFSKVMKAKVLDSFQNAFTKSTSKPGLTKIDDDFFASFDDLTFNASAFKKSLGLDEAGLPLRRKLDTLVKGLDLGQAGGKLPQAQDLLNFADAAQTFFNGKNMNISTFLTRRAALGGVESLLRVITPAAAIGGGYGAAMASPMSTLLGVGAMYYSGHILARPMLLQTFKEAFEAWSKTSAIAGSQKGYKAAYMASQRAIRELFRSDADIPDQLDNRFEMIQHRQKVMNIGAQAIQDMKDLTTGEMNESINKLLGTDVVDPYQNQGLIVPGAKVGDRTIGVDEPANITPINVTPENVIQPAASTNTNLSAKNNANNFNPSNMGKINMNSRLALAGNDPLMQGIAMNNRRT